MGVEVTGFVFEKTQDQFFCVNVAAAPLAAFQVKLQVAVTLRGLCNVLDCRCTERRTSEIGVKNDAGRIDNSPQRKAPVALEFLSDRKFEGVHSVDKAGMSVLSLRDLLSESKQNGTQGSGGSPVRMKLE
jgi:hypothetical protein